jgi:hypothetical protein
MTDPVQARSYRRPRQYVFITTLLVLAALIVLPLLM